MSFLICTLHFKLVGLHFDYGLFREGFQARTICSQHKGQAIQERG